MHERGRCGRCDGQAPEEIYATEISRETISKITDAIVGEMLAWQNRPLDRIYAVVLIDATVIKVRDAQVANRPVCPAIGVNFDGEPDVLGCGSARPAARERSSG